MSVAYLIAIAAICGVLIGSIMAVFVYEDEVKRLKQLVADNDELICHLLNQQGIKVDREFEKHLEVYDLGKVPPCTCKAKKDQPHLPSCDAYVAAVSYLDYL